MNFGGAIRINKCGVFLIGAVGFLILLYAYSGQGTSSSSSLGSYSAESLNSIPFPYGKNPGRVSLKQLLIAAVDVAIRGGVEVVTARNSAAGLQEEIKGNTKEGAKDRVTQGDFQSHRVMYYGLRKAFPGVKVISEEHTDNPDLGEVPLPAVDNDEISKIVLRDETVDADDVAVWIDPLDATQEYTENLLEFVTTMVGVAVKGVPIMGVIHRPFKEETYWALVGFGNSPNLNSVLNKKSNTPQYDNLKAKKSHVQIIVSRSHAGTVHNLTEEVFGSKEPFSITTAAGAGYKVLEVIAGRADVYLHVTNIKKWDLCAGNGLINAVGGEMTTINGDKLDYSADTNPLNTKGILAFTQLSNGIERLREIQIKE